MVGCSDWQCSSEHLVLFWSTSQGLPQPANASFRYCFFGLYNVRPGYQGARELALLPRKEDERDAGTQQFPWKRLEVVMRIESRGTQRWEQDF